MDSAFTFLAFSTAMVLLPFLVVSLTAFVKIAVVMFLVRSALGVQQTPPNLVLYGVTIVLTAYVMSPVFSASFEAVTALGADTLTDPGQWGLAYQRGVAPVRDFLIAFTTEEERAFFLQSAIEMHAKTGLTPSADDIFILAPSFVTSELTKAFEIGVLIYLPFIVIDLVITNILTAMGMMMVSPMVVSLPFKLLLFVTVDGWSRLTQGLVFSYIH